MGEKALSAQVVRLPADLHGAESDLSILNIDVAFHTKFSEQLITRITGLRGIENKALIQRIRTSFPDMASMRRFMMNATDAEMRGLIQRFQVEMELEFDLNKDSQ